MGVPMKDGRTVMAQSMWVKEGDCLWQQYSTKAVAHAVKWFSHYTIDYPYPTAWSIDGSMGMEYPMICFNYGRCADDGTYAERTKYGHIGVIIVQFLTEQHWERNYPSRRGPAHKITDYMGGDRNKISPIMTNSESIWQFGNNAYGKPATALNILRETIMGRELFDMAFAEYSKRWAFKHPSPADFFRTMEDASGVDLDWFWRGWFYTNEAVDISMSDVQHKKMDTKDPDKENAIKRAERDARSEGITAMRNKKDIKTTLADKDPSIVDFYSKHDKLQTDAIDRENYQNYYNSLSDKEKEIINSGLNYYEITFENNGGLVMPIILEFTYKDGTTELERIPAEIWKLTNDKVTKVFVKEKEIESIELDPYLETADVDRSNNHYPPQPEIDRFEMYKSSRRGGGENGMQRAKRAKNKVIKP